MTRRQLARVKHYQQQHDGKKMSDAWRDVINAGLRALGVPELPDAAGAAGSSVSAAAWH